MADTTRFYIGGRWNPAARPKDRTDIFRRTDPPPVPWGNKE